MRTDAVDLPRGFTFKYQTERHGAWHFVGGHGSPRVWPTKAQRDAARACFTHRRSVAAALADLAKLEA